MTALPAPRPTPMTQRRTSRDDPLRIDELGVGAGRLGLTFCPGKQDARWNRALEPDLAVVAGWGASTVVTLLEPQECVALGVADLGREVRARGIDWVPAPITDTQVPDARFEAAWSLAGPIVHGRLDRGERIVVHCRGGLGRAGLVGARILAERGTPPAVAIDQVRAARAGAIETEAQRQHVLATRARAVSHWRERVSASLVAGALGDAVGYLVEFDSLDGIRRRYGGAGLRVAAVDDPVLAASDDTQMTLFTLEALATARAAGAVTADAVEAQLVDAYLDWYGTQRRVPRRAVGRLARDPLLCRTRAPGNTCLASLAGGGGRWARHRTHPVNHSKGCGTVMRTAPAGWFEDWAPETAFALGQRASVITHGHPTAVLAGAAMAAITRAILGGATVAAAAEAALALLRREPGNAETVAAIEAALALATRATAPTPATLATLGEGWVAEEALAIGLYAAIRGATLVETLEIAANHSGDSDSTASIAGQLRGAADGIHALPYDAARRVDLVAPALALLEQALPR